MICVLASTVGYGRLAAPVYRYVKTVTLSSPDCNKPVKLSGLSDETSVNKSWQETVLVQQRQAKKDPNVMETILMTLSDCPISDLP